MEKFFFNLWYRWLWMRWLIWPLSLPFLLIVCFKRWRYQISAPSKSSSVPVLVVGNINVGGTGKTPFIMTLVEHLQQQEINVAIVSRGYGSQTDQYPHLIANGDDASTVGDEPWMMANRLNVPIIIDPNRGRGIEFINRQLNVDLIISDDGLQHYTMYRDYEILMYDEVRRFGNHLILPFGPLREPVWRTKSVDICIPVRAPFLSGKGKDGSINADYFIQLEADRLIRLKDGKEIAIQELEENNVNAVCALGDAEKFFNTLSSHFNLTSTRAFPDHHLFDAQDFSGITDGPVIMTEKDATKCFSFAKDNWYYLKLSGKLSSSLRQRLDNDICHLISGTK